MHKHRVLLIDDEKFIRVRLKQLIDGSSLPFEVVGEAGNGEEAIEMIDSRSPQVIFTDIRMPRMDGLAFIKEIRERHPDLHILILTGFERFEYAREALRYRVSDFLLKPISENALAEVLQKLQVSLNAIQRHEKSTVELLLRDFLNKGIDADTLWRRLSESRHCISEGVYRLAVADSVTGNMEVYPDQISFVGPHYLPVWLIRQPNQPKVSVSAALHIGVSRSYQLRSNNLELLHNAYTQALRALNCKWFSSETILYADKLNPEQPQDTFHSKYGLMRKILRDAEEGHPDSAQQQISEAFRLFREEGEADFPFLQKLVRHLNEQLEIVTGTPHLGGKETVVSWILKCRSLTELEQNMLPMAARVSRLLAEKRENANRFVDKAIAYIHDHFNEELSLVQVSRYVSLNPNYFCGLFKSVTGMNFKQYMANYRIQMAKELLLEGCWNLSEISYMVGYTDEKYFSRVFKKWTGRQPQQFGKVKKTANESV